eukprot:gene8556-10524_t
MTIKELKLIGGPKIRNEELIETISKSFRNINRFTYDHYKNDPIQYIKGITSFLLEAQEELLYLNLNLTGIQRNKGFSIFYSNTLLKLNQFKNLEKLVLNLDVQDSPINLDTILERINQLESLQTLSFVVHKNFVDPFISSMANVFLPHNKYVRKLILDQGGAVCDRLLKLFSEDGPLSSKESVSRLHSIKLVEIKDSKCTHFKFHPGITHFAIEFASESPEMLDHLVNGMVGHGKVKSFKLVTNIRVDELPLLCKLLKANPNLQVFNWQSSFAGRQSDPQDQNFKQLLETIGSHPSLNRMKLESCSHVDYFKLLLQTLDPTSINLDIHWRFKDQIKHQYLFNRSITVDETDKDKNNRKDNQPRFLTSRENIYFHDSYGSLIDSNGLTTSEALEFMNDVNISSLNLSIGDHFETDHIQVYIPHSVRKLILRCTKGVIPSYVTIPDYITKLEISVNSNLNHVSFWKELQWGSIPHSIVQLTIDYKCFRGASMNEISLVIPKSVKHLVVHGWEYKNTEFGPFFPHDSIESLQLISFSKNDPIEPGVLPSSLTSLQLDLNYGPYFSTRNRNPDGSLVCVLPESIKHLKLNSGFIDGMELNLLPKSIETLSFGMNSNNPIPDKFFPNSINSITFGYSFNQPLVQGVLPTGLKQLHFNQLLNPIDTKVVIPDTVLELSCYFKNLVKGLLPQSITRLTLLDGFRELEVGFFPSHLSKLSIHNLNRMKDLNQLVHSISPLQSLIHLSMKDNILSSKNILKHESTVTLMNPISQLSTLKTLSLPSYINQSITPEFLPNRLEKLKIYSLCHHHQVSLPSSLRRDNRISMYSNSIIFTPFPKFI